MATQKVLITGVTGFIGGTILTTLLKSTNPSIQNVQFFGLVRGKDKAEKLKANGVEPVLFQGIEDLVAIQKIASNYDIIINPAFCVQTAPAAALVRGLGERVQATSTTPHLIQTSGTSNLGDRPYSEGFVEARVFSDNDDVFGYETERNEKEAYPQRTTELVVTKLGKELGVQTHIIMSPTIIGEGTGWFNKSSIQIPTAIRAAIQHGQALVIEDGKAEWDHIHVQDLADLYELLLARVVEGKDVPSAEKGIFFSETGRHSWLDLATGIAEAGVKLGELKSAEVKHISLEEAQKIFGGDHPTWLELGFASNSRTKADRFRQWGWKPVKTEQDWLDGFEDDWKAVLEQQKGQ